jgi:hypothetical protein
MEIIKNKHIGIISEVKRDCMSGKSFVGVVFR